MFTLYGQPKNIHDLNERCIAVLSKFVNRLSPPSPSRNFTAGTLAFRGADLENSFYFIVKGYCKLSIENRAALHLEPGELIGRHLVTSAQDQIIAESDLELREIPNAFLHTHLKQDPELISLWESYLLSSLKVFSALVAHVASMEYPINPSTNYYNSGDPIIIQETSPTDVYHMLHGTAAVYVGEIQVGEVFAGEIFGAMSLVMEAPRSASVIASTPCVVATLKEHEFMILLRTQPSAVHKILTSMARIVYTQNQKIVEMIN